MALEALGDLDNCLTSMTEAVRLCSTIEEYGLALRRMYRRWNGNSPRLTWIAGPC